MARRSFEDLTARTNGRLVCGDGDPKAEQKAFAAVPEGADPPITIAHDPNGLWVELTIPTSHGP